MNLPRLILMCFAVSLAFISAQPADFPYGVRPPVPLFDPSGFLTPDQTAKITEPLQALYKNENIDVIAVVLPELGDAPPEHVARRFGEAWCSPLAHAIVLFSPGRKDGPWIIPGGQFLGALKTTEVEKKVLEAQKRASRERYASEKIRAATVEASDLLRYWTGGVQSYGESLQVQREAYFHQLARKRQMVKYLGMAAACSVIPSGLFIWWLIRRRKQTSPRYFSKPLISRRLGAPYCGGNSVILNLETPNRNR